MEFYVVHQYVDVYKDNADVKNLMGNANGTVTLYAVWQKVVDNNKGIHHRSRN